MNNKITLLVGSILLAMTTLTVTQAMAETMAETIKKRAGAIAEIKGFLNDSDPNIRIAALDSMLKSDDTAMREMAYSMGLNSADDTLRAITLRNKFNSLNVLGINFKLPEDADEKIKSTFAKYGGGIVLNLRKYDEKNGRFEFKPNYIGVYYDGNISGLMLQFDGGSCNGNLTFNEESIYSGDVTCNGITFPATLNII
ncbi:HEAT repeat domain-containing protein [Shewanella sp. ALD9]|uniref:HEAT repeat domain-containing protein n=1 Tax=Shewanella sp. ALD9 TaxID=2058330 RepID=UPI000C31FD55|nr:HEAT repeat domain-containing protein [Shewanella sp. ALD9]PKH33593.1 hypothetical protein CXF88_05740 [Shewanella sp. ALD9]